MQIVSVLYREPKVLKLGLIATMRSGATKVSVLYREPKVLKLKARPLPEQRPIRFSALP